MRDKSFFNWETYCLACFIYWWYKIHVQKLSRCLAICKKFGYPDLFITITCNVNWSEIREFVLARGLSASDTPDIAESSK